MRKPMNASENQLGLIVQAEDTAYADVAESLAKHLQVAYAEKASDTDSFALVLRYGANGLSLMGNGQVLRGDFTQMLPRLRKNNLSGELLIKAAKIKGKSIGLTVIDATAGMGEDSLLLAAAGFTVELYEYNPVIAALLHDTLLRAKEHPQLKEIVGRMHLQEANSVEALSLLSSPPDIVFLDPMFPARQKSALIKKKFQLLHFLEQPCDEENELLCAAMQARPQKIVIKRPKNASFLAGRKPSYSLDGSTIRYDCLVLTREESCDADGIK